MIDGRHSRCVLCALGLAGVLVASACKDRGYVEVIEPTPTPEPLSEEQIVEQKNRQVSLLMRLMLRDPEHFTYERAFIDEQNELSLLLNRDMDMDHLPMLMRAIMSSMVREFKLPEITVVLYQVGSDPPRRLGKVRADALRRTLTHLPEDGAAQPAGATAH